MADVTSNLDEFAFHLEQLVGGFNFQLPGKTQSVGRDLAVEAAEGIIARTVVDGEDATGGPLKANAPAWAARKAKAHGVHQPGVLTGQTLSLASVLGTPKIAADEIVMTHGTGQPPAAYSTKGTIKGDEPTDTQKGQWLTDQGRPFYELDDRIEANLIVVAGEGLERYLEEHR